MTLEERRVCTNCGATNIGQQDNCLLCGHTLAASLAQEKDPDMSAVSGEGDLQSPSPSGPTPRPAIQRRERAGRLRFFLDGQGGEVRGKRYPLHQQALIGRDVKADINLYDGQVSRRHSMILVESEGIVIRDLGSANGTFVNGRRITGSVVLKPDDLITVGASSWKLVIVRR
jgi:hypothetical protein